MKRVYPFILSLALGFGCTSTLAAQDYKNPDLPIERRVDDLVGRMTLEEKVSQMWDEAPAIDRLGIPQYNWWNEGLHGVARSGLATVFPQAIGLAATWNQDLIYRMATAISDEARAKHHEYVRKGQHLRYQGLTLWSPNINIFRDPRWGRGQETYGEDPYLTGTLGVQFVRGLQGNDPNYLKTIATVKHYAVHSGPEPDRHTFDAVVGERDFRETYLPHFERTIKEGGSYSIMCAYNRVAGEAACASNTLLQEILKGEWGFNGYVTSDCWAINDIYQYHKIVEKPSQAAAMSVRAGTDLDCGSNAYRRLVDAVKEGLITEDEITQAVKRLFVARFRLGMFDPPERVQYTQIPYSTVDSPKHRELARQVARESIVLLKNQGNVLPLKKDLGTLAVIGPNTDQWLMLLGNYNGIPSEVVTPLRGIKEAVSKKTKVISARGSELVDGFPFFDTLPDGVLFTPDGKPGIQVQYYGNRDLSGEPLSTEVAPRLDANWHDRAPRADMDADNFGVRWTGVIRPQVTGTYQLGLISSMGFRFTLDDSLVVGSSGDYRRESTDPRIDAGKPVTLEAGKNYRILVEAQETYSDAQAQLVWAAPSGDLQAEAIAAARQADAVVMFLGLTPRLEGEEMPVQSEGFKGGDRTSLDLPASQQALLEAVVALGKPVVLVLLNGSALSINWAQDHVPAIVDAWYPGQAAGAAIADVLFGDYNPAGRLPVTFYRSVNDLPPFDNYDMKGRTYRFFEGKPLYAFGHGLSYTTFEYTNLRTGSETLKGDGSVKVSVDVANTGKRAGDEVVQLYVSYPGSKVSRPIRDLKGYKRITLRPGEKQTVVFELKASDLAYWDEQGDKWVVEAAPVSLQAGASSADVRLEKTIQVTN